MYERTMIQSHQVIMQVTVSVRYNTTHIN